MRTAMRRLLLLFCLILCSCVDYNGECCDDLPEIMFSKYELSFNMQERIDSTFAINSNYWWLDDKSDYLQKECEYIKPVNEPNYCNDNYCNDNKELAMKIDCPWFSAVKTNERTMLVSVKQNDTDESRGAVIDVRGVLPSYAHIAYGKIVISQCPEPVELSKKELSFSAEGGTDSVTVAMNRNIELHPEAWWAPWYSIYTQGLSILMEAPWSINMPDKNTITVSVSKNETGQRRGFVIYFGGRCEKIEVTQSAE